MQIPTENTSLWQFLLFGKWKTIKAKFLHTLLDIVGASLLIFVATTLTFLWLRQDALLLANKSGPMALAASNLNGGLQKSLAAIHGWMSIPDPAFIQSYHAAWDNVIWPNQKKLEQLAKKFNDQEVLQALYEAQRVLAKLYNAQWKILDIGHTIGNNKALSTVYLNLEPTLRDLVELTMGLRAIEKKNQTINSMNRLVLLVRLKEALMISLLNLKSYSMGEVSTGYRDFNINFQKAITFFKTYKNEQLNMQLTSWDSREKTALLSSLTLELTAFETTANKVVAYVREGDIDVAKNQLETKVLPLEHHVSQILQRVMSQQQDIMLMNSKEITWLGKVTPWVMTVLIISLLITAIILALVGATKLVNPIIVLSEATKKMSSHELNEDLPIPGKDELGQLTMSFNQMRASLQASEEQTERLLLNILPASIVERLREGEQIIADRFNDVSVLFLDIVNFTPLAAKVTPEELIRILSQLYNKFDQLVEQHHLEKIKTIGDAYMVAGGVPEPNPAHLHQTIDFGLDVLCLMPEFNREHQTQLQVRIGLHCGAVIAGVISQKRFTYDLWGDTVNIASRMESHGVIERLQVTDSVYQRVCDDYAFESRGEINIKGKESVQAVYLLKNER